MLHGQVFATCLRSNCGEDFEILFLDSCKTLKKFFHRSTLNMSFQQRHGWRFLTGSLPAVRHPRTNVLQTVNHSHANLGVSHRTRAAVEAEDTLFDGGNAQNIAGPTLSGFLIFA
jgi:hypothetical protein